MPEFSQKNRPISVKTPLGEDVLLLESFTGSESISAPFRYDLNLLAEDPKKVTFDKLLGKEVTITILLPEKKKRYISGTISRFSQVGKVPSAKKGITFVRYRAEIVPKFWFLQRIRRSRIFEQLTVLDILKEVLKPIKKIAWQVQAKLEKREYCVQYQESDFDFACRLMEEEGIFYFFKHSEKEHEMVVADSAQAHVDVPGAAKVTFEESGSDRVQIWEKTQSVHSGKYTLRDYSFEMPDKDLKVSKETLANIKVGTVDHKLKVAENSKYEIIEYPGYCAKRFDGVNPGGGDQASRLQKITPDSERTVGIRMEQETLKALKIEGESDCRQFISGHKFTLEGHFDANGAYILTQMRQRGSIAGAYTAGGAVPLDYANAFQCIPDKLPFRPAPSTPKPVMVGTQTAKVIAGAGQEIFTDKYSRVKVQFHWEDQYNSCWVRVGTYWAGKLWGAVHIPRIDQEVIIAFMEGDPDQPIIVGSVYNADQMPPYALTDNQTQSGIKSRSSLEGKDDMFNELRFEDKKDNEQIYFHAQKNFDRVVENNDTLLVGSDKADEGSQTIEIYKDRTETIKTGDEKLTIEKGSRTDTITEGDDTLAIEKGSRTTTIKTDDTLTVEGKQTFTITGDHSMEVKTGNYSNKVSAGAVTIEAAQSIELKVGSNSIKIDPSGITIKGSVITVQGQTIGLVGGAVTVSGASCAITTGTVAIG